jgi:hypothetical protein
MSDAGQRPNDDPEEEGPRADATVPAGTEKPATRTLGVAHVAGTSSD